MVQGKDAAGKRNKGRDNPQSPYWERKCKEKVNGRPLWAVACRIMWDDRCALWREGQCGESGKLDCHHIFTRSRKVLRYRPINLILLCAKHHQYNAGWSGHKAGISLGVYLANIHPGLATWIERTAPKLNDPAYLKSWDWQADYEDLRKIVDKEAEYRGTCGMLGGKP